MAMAARDTIAFGMPGGDGGGLQKSRPVDLAHLARQTLGDRDLEREVLCMFVHQIGSVRERIATADAAERKMLAHTLKGSARGIGAFALADCAGEIEEAPASAAAVTRLTRLIDEVRDFIAAIHR